MEGPQGGKAGQAHYHGGHIVIHRISGRVVFFTRGRTSHGIGTTFAIRTENPPSSRKATLTLWTELSAGPFTGSSFTAAFKRPEPSPRHSSGNPWPP